MPNHTPAVIRSGGPIAVTDLPEATQDRIKHFQAAAQSRNTSNAYGVQLGLFRRWCAQHGYADAPPTAPAIVAAWLTERAAAGCSRSTLGAARAAIKVGHEIAGQPVDGGAPHLP